MNNPEQQIDLTILDELTPEQIVDRLKEADLRSRKLPPHSPSANDKPASRKVRRKLRASDRKDKQTTDMILEFEPRDSVGETTPSAVNTNTSSASVSLGKGQSSPAAKPANDNKKSVPSWQNSRGRMKLFWASKVMERSAFEFTLNLGPTRELAARLSPQGFTAYMRLKINSAMKARLGYEPMFWFVPDISPSGRLHLHGMIVGNERSYFDIRAALVKAGGQWASKYHKDKQAQLRLPKRHFSGWITYCLRNIGRVRRATGDKGIAITNDLRRTARTYCEEQRAKLKVREAQKDQ